VVFQGRQELTHRWWQRRRKDFDLSISQLVLDEAWAGDLAAAAERLRMLEGLPLLGESTEADRLADLLIARHLLPPKAAADAQHVALAATAGGDYLLTWNCKHIANAELLPAMYETLRGEGFPITLIVTPEEFSDAG
jgi:predicted nucleic acid-binding protein